MARFVTLEEFGRFALFFASYLLILGFLRGLVGEVLLVRSSETNQGQDDQVRAAIAITVLVAGGFSLIFVAIYFALGLSDPLLLSAALVLPGTLVQDTYRFAMFSQSKARAAFMNDLLAFTTFMVAIILVLLRNPEVKSWQLVLAWGFGYLLAALLVMHREDWEPDFLSGIAWFRENRGLGLRFGAEQITITGADQVLVYVVAALFGLGAAGVLRGGQALMGPVAILFMGTRMVTIPLARVLPVEKLWRMSLLLSGILGGVSLAWGVMLDWFPIGRLLLGDLWEKVNPYIDPFVIVLLGVGISSGAATGLRGLADARRSLKARLNSSLLIVGGGVGGFAALDFAAGVKCLAVASVTASFGWWWQFRSSIANGTRP